MKSEKDQEKGEKLQAISEIVQHLTNSINVWHYLDSFKLFGRKKNRPWHR